MDSWEDEEFEPPKPIVASTQASKWDDEDKEEEAPAAWDDEPPKKDESKGGKKEVAKAKKPSGKKGQTGKSSGASKVVEEDEDPMVKKRKDQLRVEESDFQNTQDVFSGLDSVSVISTSDPKDEKDFEALADVLGKKLTVYEKSFHYRGFLKSLLKHTTQNLKAEEIKDLAAALTVISNEKLKMEKGGGKKKKVTAAKKALNVKEDDVRGPEDFDDYSDFM
jgi:hypothetical protein